jgi:hypothetical protein
MSNKQFLDTNYSVVNNSIYRYTNTQGFGVESSVKLPFNEKVKVELRNYKSKPLTHRGIKGKNFLSNNIKIFPYKVEPVILKENEVRELSAWDLAEIHSQKCSKREETKRKILEEKIDIVEKAIKNRIEKNIVMEEKEKLQLEKDIVTIIAHALRFSKKNTPLTAMISNEMNEQLLKIGKERRMSSKSSGNLNKSIGSLINTSNLSCSSNTVKYDSNRFLKALGLDVNNLRPDNIQINIDNAISQIEKWRLVDKSKLRNLIRMRVINEISSIEERRTVRKLRGINEKLKNLKSVGKATKSKIKNLDDKNITNISSIENKESRDVSQYNYNSENVLVKDKSGINNETNTMQKSTTMKTYLDDFSKLSKQKTSKGKGKKYEIRIEPKKKEKPRTKLILNSYHQADKLLKIVYGNPNTKENTNLVRHFENINNYREADNMINKVIFRNRIVSNIGEEAKEIASCVNIPNDTRRNYSSRVNRQTN